MENGNRQPRSGLQDERQVNLVDPSRPARRGDLTRPIEEGTSNVYGQAGRYEDLRVEHDSASLLHTVNQEISNGIPSTQPVEASPSLGAPFLVVPSAAAGHTHEQQHGDRQESFGVQFRSGFCYPSTSGLSSYGMNEPSGGHLRPFPSASSNVHAQLGVQTVLQQLQSDQQAVKEFLQLKLGVEQYEKQRQKCLKSYINAGVDHDTALTYSYHLLVFIDVRDFEKVKCSVCNARHDIGLRISHESDCLVQQGYDQAQSRMLRENEGQPEARGTSGSEGCEGSNMVPPRPSLPTRRMETIRHQVVEEGSEEDRNRSLLEVERNERSAGGRSGTPWITQPPTTSAAGFQTALVSQQGPTGDPDITQMKTKNSSDPDVFEQLLQMGYTPRRIREIRRISGKELNRSVDEFLREEELYANNPTGVRSSIQRFSQSYHTAHAAAGSQQNTYQSATNYKHTEYADIQTRQESFQNWPADAVQTPATLTEAGLYYTGGLYSQVVVSIGCFAYALLFCSVIKTKKPIERVRQHSGYISPIWDDASTKAQSHEDVCRCFACGGKLQKWDAEDNPWFEHARFFPHCPFLQQKRGKAFIDSVLKKCREKEKNPPRSNQANIAPRMETKALEDPLSSPVAKLVLEMGYTEEKVREAIIKANGKARFGAEVTAEQILNFLLEEENDVGSLTNNFRTQSLSSVEPASSANMMDASICGACNLRKIGVSQYHCGHIVCYTCAPNGQMGGSCKICGQKVVKVVAYDPTSKS